MALSSSLVSLGVLVGIFGLLALGLNVKFGYTGLLDIGHVAFFLTGAYLTALLVAPPASTQQFGNYVLGWNWPWLPALAAATVVAGILGLLVALPAIRLREDYLAITVLGISVILRRIVQSEGWLANGPDSLRGYPLPLREFFPLPGEDPASAVLFGVVVGVIWAGATYLLARYLGDRDSPLDVLTHAVFAVTTLGVGYAASRVARRNGDGPDFRASVGGGLVAGVVAAGGMLATAGTDLAVLVLVVFLGAASLFGWLFGAAYVVRYFGDLTASDVGTSLAMALAFVVVFMPVVFLGAGTGTLATVVLLVGFLAGVYYAATNWETVGTPAPFARLVGAAAVWLFLVRYFLLSMASQLTNGDVGGAVFELIQNVLWLARFTPAGVEFDYSRFLLAATFGAFGVAYYLMEATVNSPFGRVLKAIREDEDVATSLGKNTFAYKVQSMVLGSAVAGLAGGLYAVQIPALTHTLFAPRITFIAFLIVIIGGTANNKGALLGAVIYWAFWKGTVDLAAFFPTEVRSSVQALRLAVFGALFIVILYYRPEGILGEEGTQAGGG